MKKRIKKIKYLKTKVSKKNLLYINILFIIFAILEIKAITLSIFPNNSLNLNLAEVDANYDKEKSQQNNTEDNNNATNISYQEDNSWNWPASSSYYISSNYNSGHPAIDIVSTNGDYNIYAAYGGVIVTNSYKWDGGNYLVLKQDNGYYSLYCHLSQKLVNEGERVEKGQLIGIMGRTGLATGVHLHYSIWNGYPYHHSSSINPLNFY